MFAGGKIQLLVQESKSHPAPWSGAYVIQNSYCKHPKQTNGFAVLAGKKGVAKQEQQKRINTDMPNTTQLLILLLW